MKRYAVLGIMLALVVAGAYWSGYAVGSRNVKIEYAVREKEVIKYVEKKKADIYVKPNASRIDLLQLMHDGKL